MGSSYNEETVELAALDWLRGQGFDTAFGPDIAPETPGAQRASHQDLMLDGPLRAALVRLNSGTSPEAVVEAVRQLSNPVGVGLQANQGAHSSARGLSSCWAVPVESLSPARPAGDRHQNSITEVTPV